MMNTELTARFLQLDKQVWDSVSKAVFESTTHRLTFSSEQFAPVEPDTITGELAAPFLVLQFSLTDIPEHPMMVLLSQNTFTQLLRSLSDADADNFDESMISEIRPALEAIVQGICLAIGAVHESPVVASGLTMRFQPAALTNHMVSTGNVLRSSFKIAGEEVTGEGMWLIDDKAIRYMVYGPEDESLEEAVKEQPTLGEVSEVTTAIGRNNEDSSLEILHDIPLEISVELGRVRMVVKDILDISAGSIIEIDKAAGEPVDVLVNGRLVARGEVVVIEDNFGVRITEILSPQERLAKLGQAA